MKNNIKYKMAYRSNNNLRGIINTDKDKTPKDAQNNVVYKIECLDCEASYVEQMKRKLCTRMREHKKLKPDNNNIVANHAIDCNYKFDWDKVKILDTGQCYFKRLISKMVYQETQ